MKEIVWVYGPSAAGKETFVRKASQPESEDLRQKLGWGGQLVVPCGESIEWVGRRRIKDDPDVLKREQLVSVVQRVVTQADVVLIKGQDVDLVANRPNQLLAAEPTYLHKVIYLAVSVAELMQRLPSKPWWNGTDTAEDVLGWTNYQLDMLQKLDPKFALIAIDRSSSKQYEFTELPEQLQNRQSYSYGVKL
jgi:predicted kinase